MDKGRNGRGSLASVEKAELIRILTEGDYGVWCDLFENVVNAAREPFSHRPKLVFLQKEDGFYDARRAARAVAQWKRERGR